MRKIEVIAVKSTLYTGEDSWQVRIWHNESQSTTLELSKSELENLHVQTTDAFITAYGTITHSR